MRKYEYQIAVWAIVSITTLTTVAMAMGHDGVLYMSAVSVIGGLAGYHVARARK